MTFTDADRVTLVQAKPRQQVTVTADPKPYTAGDMFKREFVRWKVIDGIEVSPEDQMKPSFTFEMPETMSICLRNSKMSERRSPGAQKSTMSSAM